MTLIVRYVSRMFFCRRIRLWAGSYPSVSRKEAVHGRMGRQTRADSYPLAGSF